MTSAGSELAEGLLEPGLDIAALDWLERDPSPRLIVRHDLFVCWLNSAAKAFLIHVPDIDLSGGVLLFSNKIAEARFTRFVTSVVLSGSLYLGSEERQDFLLVRAERLPDGAAGPMVAVTMNSRSWAAQSVRFEGLEIAFSLTPREVHIVTLLARGNSVASIVTEADCAVETVRRHVKNIYVKIGVSTREELLNRLQPFRW